MFKDIADRRQGFRDKRNKKGRDGGKKQRYGSRPSKVNYYENLPMHYAKKIWKLLKIKFFSRKT